MIRSSYTGRSYYFRFPDFGYAGQFEITATANLTAISLLFPPNFHQASQFAACIEQSLLAGDLVNQPPIRSCLLFRFSVLPVGYRRKYITIIKLTFNPDSIAFQISSEIRK